MFRTFVTITVSLAILTLLAGAGVLWLFWHYGQGLPDYQQLADYEPPVMTRVHAGDGHLITEYAVEKRIFVPVEVIPTMVIKAFLAAEDKNFYSHPGIDVLGVVRAALTNISHLGGNRRPVGASTITQQVAKNFLLSAEVSFERKIKEAILAFRIERAFSKNRILELYLNEIYLGFGSYGVAAAALNYFNTPLDQLSVAEVAFLAALPKAPNNYHPVRRHKAARARRDWVLARMEEVGFIPAAEAAAARAVPLVIRPRAATLLTKAEYFAEEVRRELAEHYGETKLYRGGLSVRTTLDSNLQAIADEALHWGLVAYDRRHGWRGPISRIAKQALVGPWAQHLARIEPPKALPASWRLAVVLKVAPDHARIGLGDGIEGTIPLAELRWARRWIKEQKRGPLVKTARDVLAPGDVVAVEPVESRTVRESGQKVAKTIAYSPGTFGLRQIPEVNGGLVALDPHTGRVLAMSGGFSFGESQFNRAIQARRQPGSAFKPFVYLAALDSGFTPSSLILDAPFVIDQGPGRGLWKPHNYARRFYGPSTMRLGIEKSRNLMTVRLAQTIGMDKVAAYAKKFGIHDDMPEILSMALGAGETTLLRLTTAYATLVNGGRKITPTLIDRIQDRHGRTIFRHDTRPCPGCRGLGTGDEADMPAIPDNRKRLADPGSAYQVVSMLQGVVQRGTGRRIRAIGKPLAGKTGTTNKGVDTWFIGFTPDLAAGAFIGFDEPKPLGKRETGSSVAAPVFKRFMERALAKTPGIPFRIPPGIRMVRVNPQTGLPARSGDRRVILEAFKPGTEPTGKEGVVDGGGAAALGGARAGTTRGLY
jgi:penicillin-binding protein 1A